MPLDNPKVKFNISELIKSLNNQKNEEDSKYEKDLKDYEMYVKKQAIKISGEIRRIADRVEEADFDRLNTRYNNKIHVELKNTLRDKPSKPDHRHTDNTIRALRLSSDDSIILKQSEYNRLFEGY